MIKYKNAQVGTIKEENKIYIRLANKKLRN